MDEWRDEVERALEDFSGVVPVFPLPGTVFFPRTVLLLHIFEPRYREMLADAMEGEQLIGVTMLRPGYELGGEERPPIHEIGGLGKVARAVQLPDGRSNIALLGLSRFVIREELPPEKSYRLARIGLVGPDGETPLSSEDPQERARRLTLLAEQAPPSLVKERGKLEAATRSKLPLGTAVDLVVDALDLPADIRQRVLEEADPVARADLAIVEISRRVGDPTKRLERPGDWRRLWPPPPPSAN